jgi:8-oxo-dGTP pyrophosphatase MutT (NUDIX family)
VAGISENHADTATSDVPIRDAACLLIADTTGPEPKLLMGRRHADQVFLPDKWVFPGGRVEDEDRWLARRFADPFSPIDLAPEIRPFALAAIRELFEEAGVLIGGAGALRDPGPAWLPFAVAGMLPAPTAVYPLARAITPPGRVRRYDTWFFLANANAIAGDVAATDGELLDLGWFTVSEASDLDVPNITRLVLNDVGDVFRGACALGNISEGLPFYYSDGMAFRRDLISCKVTPLMP